MVGSHSKSISFLLLVISISADASLYNNAILQTIDIMDSDYFLEGAEFELSKQNKGCLLKGVGYGETGQNKYEFYFNDTGLIDAQYTSYRYEMLISEFKNEEDMVVVDVMALGESPENDKAILELYNEFKKLITPTNLAKCISL